jgi:hypothetical protein
LKFWDSSAIVPLILEEPWTNALLKLHNEDPVMIVWWFTELECASALARLELESLIENSVLIQSFKMLARLTAQWQEIQPVQKIKVISKRLLRVHNLRTADSSQLAAAILANEKNQETLPFVCLDKKLNKAAMKEGFSCLPLEF